MEPNNAGRHYHLREVKSLGKSWSIRRRQQQQHMAQVVACSEKMLKDFDTVGWTDSWKPGKGAGVQMSPVCHQCLDITQIFAPSSFPSWRTVSEWVMFSDWRELLLLLTFACFFCISAVMQWYVVRNDYTFWKNHCNYSSLEKMQSQILDTPPLQWKTTSSVLLLKF